ncbi:MAG: tRNA pseudouridine(55) synthase TruB [Bdellovibrionaceae bacterium]|nr:tRNA pseudouridine(55) synthase TruB [Pseudobdellovibrionaceae bacterium]
MKLNGLLLLDKPMGMTSHDVVARVRRLLSTREVGHAGTLDPMATGLLVLLVGQGTKLSQIILEGNKGYRARALLGVETDTLDTTGNVLKESAEIPDSEKVFAAARSLVGEFQWPVPAYSAVKVDGKRLYQSARSGERVSTPEKPMRFWNLQLLGFENRELSFAFECSKGSYVRSWVEQLGIRLGCGATMSGLVRTASFPFHLDEAGTLERLAEDTACGRTPAYFVPMEKALRGKSLNVGGYGLKLIRNGQIPQDLRTELIRIFNPDEDQYVQVKDQKSGALAAVLGLDREKGFVIRRVFTT